MKKIITVGIPAYKAEGHICDCLASIQIQSIRDEVAIVIAKDNPSDDYNFVKKCFPNLDITILNCDKNTGPGLARQRCLDACKTDWVTFIDADDVFANPMALEQLKFSITPDCVEVQGVFMQEAEVPNMPTQLIPHMEPEHPWVFGRLYNVKFLQEAGICFSELRAIN